MAATSRYLAFDLGASGGRAVLGEFDGQRLRLTQLHRFANDPVRILGHWHWDVVRLFHEVKTALAKAAALGEPLDGIGVDTWGVDYALLSARGTLLGLPFHYRDERTLGMLEAALRRVPRGEVYAQTGIQFMEINTLYQLLAAQRDDHRLLDQADKLLFMPDLLNYWLTGVMQSEYTIASTSQLYRATGDGWATGLLERFGLPTKIMPTVGLPGTVLGELHPDLAADVGLVATAVIATASHDTAAAVAAVPAQGENYAYLSVGTWALVGAELRAPLCTPSALQANFTNEGGVAGTIRFLKNATGLWLLQECKRTWDAQGMELPHDRLAHLAAAAPGQTSFVDPDDARFAAPGDMPRRIQEYCAGTSQPVPQSPGEIVRCVLESLALKCGANVTALEQIIGRPVNTLHLVGGGVKNRLLCQLVADTTGCLVIAGPAEATAAGNLMVQALACGRVASLGQIRAVIADSTALERYEPTQTAGWCEVRGRFAKLLVRPTRV